MSLFLVVLWAIGVTCTTLIGSLYARRSGRPDLLVGLYVAFVLTAQMLAAKLAAFSLGYWSFTAPAGVLVFSVTFLLTDIVNERFGRKETQRMIFIAFIAQIAMAFFIWLGTQFDIAPQSEAQGNAWNTVFSLVPQITVASWLAFLISENVDAYIYSLFRRLTNGHHLWLRNVVSTLPALVVDSFIFVPLAYLGHYSFAVMLIAIKGQVLLKWLVGVINVPFMYLNYAILRRGDTSPDHVSWEGGVPDEK